MLGRTKNKMEGKCEISGKVRRAQGKNIIQSKNRKAITIRKVGL